MLASLAAAVKDKKHSEERPHKHHVVEAPPSVPLPLCSSALLLRNDIAKLHGLSGDSGGT